MNMPNAPQQDPWAENDEVLEFDPVSYRPLVHYIVVMPVKPPSKSKGGIILTSESQEQIANTATRGIVVAMGEKSYDENVKQFKGLTLKPRIGDWVEFGKYAGTITQGRSKDKRQIKLRLLDDDEILAIVEGPIEI